MQRVWYVAYGSNLCLARFRCYLAGGTPVGGRRRYDGCRDPHDPAEVAGIEVPGGLVFAGRSTVWGGGMAFYDRQVAGRVAGRGYLVTVDQFADIAAQEMRRAPGGRFARRLAAVLAAVLAGTASAPELGPGRYETLARVGTLDGAPMATVTCADVRGLDPVAPSAPYLRCIAAGLREAHGWDAEGIAGYLAAFPGVAGAWAYDDLVAVAGAPST